MQYATPAEAEDAFYSAFSRCDLNAMMQVWLAAEHIECIHPGMTRLQGIDAIRFSWEQIFADGQMPQIHIVRHHCTQAGNLAIHSVSEQIQTEDANTPLTAEVIATNIYELTPEGWRMILHHASPARVSQHQSGTMH